MAEPLGLLPLQYCCFRSRAYPPAVPEVAAMPYVQPTYDMEQKLREFNEQGYVIFEQLFDPDVLDGIYPEYQRLYQRVFEREMSMKGTCECGPVGLPTPHPLSSPCASVRRRRC
jgi:hypothetical protein